MNAFVKLLSLGVGAAIVNELSRTSASTKSTKFGTPRQGSRRFIPGVGSILPKTVMTPKEESWTGSRTLFHDCLGLDTRRLFDDRVYCSDEIGLSSGMTREMVLSLWSTYLRVSISSDTNKVTAAHTYRDFDRREHSLRNIYLRTGIEPDKLSPKVRLTGTGFGGLIGLAKADYAENVKALSGVLIPMFLNPEGERGCDHEFVRLDEGIFSPWAPVDNTCERGPNKPLPLLLMCVNCGRIHNDGQRERALRLLSRHVNELGIVKPESIRYDLSARVYSDTFQVMSMKRDPTRIRMSTAKRWTCFRDLFAYASTALATLGNAWFLDHLGWSVAAIGAFSFIVVIFSYAVSSFLLAKPVERFARWLISRVASCQVPDPLKYILCMFGVAFGAVLLVIYAPHFMVLAR